MAAPTDTYFSFFLSRPLWETWNLFLLTMARIVPVIVFVPFLGGKILPNSLKIGFGIAVSMIFLPYLIVHADAPPQADVLFILLMIKEAIIGMVLGLLISLPFYYAQAAGTLIDHQRGSQSLQVTDPSTQVQASPTGLLYNNVLLATYFGIGGPLLFFEGVLISYQVMPAEHFLSAAFYSQQTPLFTTLVKYCNLLITMALQLSAPSLITILMSDLFLGIANRMAPQVQISFLLWSLKAFLGIAVLWAAWWFILKQMDILSFKWTESFTNLITEMGEITRRATS